MKIVVQHIRWRWPILALVAGLFMGGLIFVGLSLFGVPAKLALEDCPVIIPGYTTEYGIVAIDESFNGKTVDILVGEQLIVVVTYFPPTGYGWSLKEISNIEILSKEQAIYNPGDS